MDGLKTVELFAWMGEDEFGSGVIGIKQGLVPAGYIPLVATDVGKIGRDVIRAAMSIQAGSYGKKIYLCRFVFAEVVCSTPDGAPLP